MRPAVHVAEFASKHPPAPWAPGAQASIEPLQMRPAVHVAAFGSKHPPAPWAPGPQASIPMPQISPDLHDSDVGLKHPPAPKLPSGQTRNPLSHCASAPAGRPNSKMSASRIGLARSKCIAPSRNTDWKDQLIFPGL
jgi:hypothetical protein